MQLDDTRAVKFDAIHAAQYVRVSTEHQRYAIQNQILALRIFAESREIEIVRTYTDEGKSGLHLRQRMGLQQLLKDVVDGSADFSVILVYDVSRWGRFQDTDESAHYEFLCRQAGIRVEYCGEHFENDGSPISTLVKGMKRLMAAEYSRDLSNRVYRGQKRTVEAGFHSNGPANFGLRRRIVSPDGTPKNVLELGDRKSLGLDRTMLVPGPQDEIRLVRWIFKTRASGKTLSEISRRLKKSNWPAAQKRRWGTNMLGRLLENEIYIGNRVWNKESIKLGTGRGANSPEEWIRVEGVCKPIVSKELFERAQRVVEKRFPPQTDEQLLDGLRRLLNEKKRLTRLLILADKRIPCVQIYDKRFGGLLRAYELIGYVPSKHYWNPVSHRTLHEIRMDTAKTAVREIRRRGKPVEMCPGNKSIIINGDTRILFMAARCITGETMKDYWEVRLAHRFDYHLRVIARVDADCSEVIDYYLLPKGVISGVAFRIFNEYQPKIDRYRCNNLQPLYAMAAYGRQKMPRNRWVRKAIEFTQAQ